MYLALSQGPSCPAFCHLQSPCLSVLQAMESRVGPGNKATLYYVVHSLPRTLPWSTTSNNVWLRPITVNLTTFTTITWTTCSLSQEQLYLLGSISTHVHVVEVALTILRVLYRRIMYMYSSSKGNFEVVNTCIYSVTIPVELFYLFPELKMLTQPI